MARHTQRYTRVGPHPDHGPRGRIRRRRGWLRKLAVWSMVAAIWLTVALGALAAWYAYDLPDPTAAIHLNRAPALTLLAADGSLIDTVGSFYGEPVEVE